MKEKLTRPITRVIVAHFWNKANLSADGVDQFYRRLGFLRTPYHYTVDPTGTITPGRPLQWPGGLDDSAAESKNVDAVVIGVLLDPKEKFRYTPDQNRVTDELSIKLCRDHGLPVSRIEVFGV